MAPTRIRSLIAIAAVTAVVGWGTVRVMESVTGRALPVPWLAAATLWVLALALALWAFNCRSRLPRRAPRQGAPVSAAAAVRSTPRPPMHPIVAARTAALAMAASRVGAAVGGLYVGIAVGVSVMSSEAARAVLWTALAAGLACAIIAATAYWLETMLRLPEDEGTAPTSAVPR